MTKSKFLSLFLLALVNFSWADVVFDSKSNFTSADIDKIIAGIIQKKTNSDLVILDLIKDNETISEPLNAAVLKSKAEHIDQVYAVRLSGRAVKEIASLLKSKKRLSGLFHIYGTDRNAKAIGGRLIDNEESFRVVLSTQALFEIWSIATTNGLSDNYTVRAPFIESIYGNINSLLFVRGPGVIKSNNSLKRINDSMKASDTSYNVAELIDSYFETQNDLLSFLNNQLGKPHSALLLNISYFDIGFSKNVANDVYKEYLKSKTLPQSRAGSDTKTHLFLLGKISLTYDNPTVVTSLTADAKYFHIGMKEKPLKDKASLGLNFRLPWERSLFKNSPVIISPIFNTAFETKIAPHLFTDNDKLVRTKKFNSLLGANFNFTNLGFKFDLGAKAVLDFAHDQWVDRFGFGPALHFTSRWNLVGPFQLSSDIKAYHMFSLPASTALNRKEGLGIEGTAWLRVAHFHGFSISIMNDFFISSLQSAPDKVALSSIFGLTVSYGKLFKLFG